MYLTKYIFNYTVNLPFNGREPKEIFHPNNLMIDVSVSDVSPVKILIATQSNLVEAGQVPPGDVGWL